MTATVTPQPIANPIDEAFRSAVMSLLDTDLSDEELADRIVRLASRCYDGQPGRADSDNEEDRAICRISAATRLGHLREVLGVTEDWHDLSPVRVTTKHVHTKFGPAVQKTLVVRRKLFVNGDRDVLPTSEQTDSVRDTTTTEE